MGKGVGIDPYAVAEVVKEPSKQHHFLPDRRSTVAVHTHASKLLFKVLVRIDHTDIWIG